MKISQPALMFSHPNLPYSWECLSEDQSGYYCLFNEEFLSLGNSNKVLSASPLRLGGHYVFFLDKEMENFVSLIFKKMIDEYQADYQFKNELLLNYVILLVHEALKMTPAEGYFTPTDSSSRIAMFFTELLERQFPIETIYPMLDPNIISVKYRGYTTLKDSEKHYNNEYFALFFFNAEGKIKEYHEYSNPVITAKSFEMIDTLLLSK